MENNVPMSPITKCVSTPASLQTIVRFQNGTPNTMSLSHQVIRFAYMMMRLHNKFNLNFIV